MNRPCLSLSLILAAGIISTAASQPESSRKPVAVFAAPRTDHAVGYYDPGLRRVVLIGNAGDPTDAERDKVWSWSGRRWEIVTELGPPGRTNAGAAYHAARRAAIVAGGARRSDGSTWQIVGDSWLGPGDRTTWRRISDIAARDHQSLVEGSAGR